MIATFDFEITKKISVDIEFEKEELEGLDEEDFESYIVNSYVEEAELIALGVEDCDSIIALDNVSWKN